jgi:large subunit ribosomal protein L24
VKKNKLKIKKNDKVLVQSGKDKGKTAKILKVFPEKGKVVVEGINIIKKHQRPTQNFQGGIIDRPNPIRVAKLMLVCPRCSKPTRVGYKSQDEKKVRYCKKCSETIDKL